MPSLPDLPINQRLDDVRQALVANAPLVIEAPPGTGKTTITPLALLGEEWLKGQSIVLLQPRRMAVRSVAARMAELLGEEVGDTVGYRIRFESKVSSRTRIEVLTEGLLTRRLQEDPSIGGVGLVIFDEFHERSLHADMSLLLSLEARHTIRPDLRIVIMSATLGDMPLNRILPDARRVELATRSFPVEIEYSEGDPAARLPELVARQAQRMLAEGPDGDLLVFLPGVREIEQTAELLAAGNLPARLLIHKLYGDLPYKDQARAVLPDPEGRRKLVLSTPISETSVTIEGVSTVIDSGLAKVSRFDTASGLNRLVTERISQDAAEQRAGRAGRTRPGKCLRLWTTDTQRALRRSRTPEILEADLSYFLLELTLWGGARQAENMAWLTPPPRAALDHARETLRGLQALRPDGSVTPLGRELGRLGCHPRLGTMLLRSREFGLEKLACRLVALLEERDVLRGGRSSSADIDERLTLIERVSGGGRPPPEGDPILCARVAKTASAWLARLRGLGERRSSASGRYEGACAAGLLLALAYPERIAKRRSSGAARDERFLLAQGKGALLRREDPLSQSDLLVVASMNEGSRDGVIFLAAALDQETLERDLAHLLEERCEVGWSAEARAVVAARRRACGAIVLSERRLEDPPEEEVWPALMKGLELEGGLAALPWSAEARELQARVAQLGRASPDLGLPDFSDAALRANLEDWLAPHLAGTRRAADWARLDLSAILLGRLSWPQRRALDDLVPESLALPSGRLRRITYHGNELPVLEATVQELFGWKETPRLGGGRIDLMLHVLSPARRPIQVTRDLAGFWQSTYPEIRKQLRGRYPKHKWPEDPFDPAARWSPKR